MRYIMNYMGVGKRLRMRRILGSGRVVIVAVDHGIAAGGVKGLEDPVEVIKTIAKSPADAILVTPGILEQAVDVVGDLGIILRIDGCVSTSGSGPMRLFDSVEDAVAMGADAVVVNATVGAKYESDELEKVGAVAREARRWGVPVVAEMLSERMMVNHLDFSGNGQAQLPADIAEDVAMAARIGVELGADAVKTRYSGDVESFRQIVAATGRPILVAGGPLREQGLSGTLQLVDDILQAGASGVIFGRQVWQQPDPQEVLAALCSMVHEDATVDEAIALTQE